MKGRCCCASELARESVTVLNQGLCKKAKLARHDSGVKLSVRCATHGWEFKKTLAAVSSELKEKEQQLKKKCLQLVETMRPGSC